MLVGVMALTSCVIKTSLKEEHAERKENVTAFEKVEILGSPTVYYTQGEKTEVRIEGPESLVNRLEATVEDSILKVRYKKGSFSFLHFGIDEDHAIVHVTSPDLIGVMVSGSGDFLCKSPLDTDNMKIELHGSGEVKFHSIICDHIQASVMGSGDMELGNVQTRTADFTITGSGDLNAHLHHCDKTSLELTGSGEMKVSFADCGEANCNITGSGDIELRGDLKQLTKNQIGSGEINSDGLSIQSTIR